MKSDNWEDLAELGHTIPEDGTPESLKQWQNANKEKLEEYFQETKKRITRVKGLDAQRAPKEIKDLVDGLSADALTIQDSINNVAGDDTDSGDVGDATVGGTTPAQEIQKAIKTIDPNAPEFPTLLGNDKFTELLFAKLQAAAPEQPSNKDDGNSSDDNVDGTASSSGTDLDSNIDDGESAGNIQQNLGEALSGIYLAEEEVAPSTDQDGANPPAGDEKSGSAMSIEDATKLRDEIQKMQELFGKSENENVQKINVMDIAKEAFGEIPEPTEATSETPTTQEAKAQGDQAAEVDSQKEDATQAEIYLKLIPSMDNFFSTEQATRLGFMEQFLLKSQSEMLWNLIGNLNLIAEKGQARAFTKQKEKEEADISGEGSVEAEETMQEGIGDFFKRNKEPVEISKEDQISLKTDLKALLQTLRATKVMVTSYEENMTRVSVDPGLDGSALKEQLDQYLPMVQKSIAKIVERANEAFVKATKLNAPKEEPEVTQPADDADQEEMDQDQMVEAILEAIAPALDGMHGLQEENGRNETINFVDDIYNQMRAIYAPVADREDSEGLRGFMEAGDRAKAIKQAEAMLELATKEDFIKLFPGGRIGEGGMPATVKGAIGTLTREIKKLVMIMRDVVTLASKSTIPHSKLVEIVSSLTTISKALYNSFGAKMMISGETLEQIEERLGEDENNKSLTDTPSKPGLVDKAKELAGKGLEKLKQAFGWISDEVQEVIDAIQTPLPVLEPMINAIDLSEKPDEWKNQTLQDAMQAVMWYNTQSDEQQAALKDYYSAIDANILSEDKSEFLEM